MNLHKYTIGQNEMSNFMESIFEKYHDAKFSLKKWRCWKCSKPAIGILSRPANSILTVKEKRIIIMNTHSRPTCRKCLSQNICEMEQMSHIMNEKLSQIQRKESTYPIPFDNMAARVGAETCEEDEIEAEDNEEEKAIQKSKPKI